MYKKKIVSEKNLNQKQLAILHLFNYISPYAKGDQIRYCVQKLHLLTNDLILYRRGNLLLGTLGGK